MLLKRLRHLLKALNYIKMGNRKEILKELEEIAPLLSSLKKPDRPEVPVMYFEGFADRLIRQMDLSSDTKVIAKSKNSFLDKIFWFFVQPRYALAVAGSIVILVAMIFIIPVKNTTAQFAMNVSQEEAIDYISQHIDQFDMKTLIDENLTDTDVDALMDEVLPQEDLDQIINEDIENLNIEDLL